MFEQSLYEVEDLSPAAPVQPGDLFYNYEQRSWDWSPWFFKLAGGVALAIILCLVGIAQTSLLTAKGCDSPLVGRVCQVLDTVYVSTILFGTDREIADADYERTELKEADITFVDVGGNNAPLSYPEGYFQVANPQEYAARMAAMQANPLTPTDQYGVTPTPYTVPGFPTPSIFPRPKTGTDLTNTKPNYADKKKGGVVGDIPSITDDGQTVAKAGKGRKHPGDQTTDTGDSKIPGIPDPNGTNSPKDPLDQNDISQKNVHGIYLNKRPTIDFGKETLARIEKENIDIKAPFKVTLKGTLGLAKDKNTIILKDPKPILGPDKTFGDPKMVDMAQKAVIAFGDAGWFGYLNKLESKTVLITLEQTDQVVTASLVSDQPTEEKAATVASGLNALLAIVSQDTTSDADTMVFLKTAKLSTTGKSFKIDIQLPAPVFNEMVQRKLAEVKNEPNNAPPKPESSASNRMTNNAGE